LGEGIPQHLETCQFSAIEGRFRGRVKASASIHLQGARVTCINASSHQYTSKFPSFHENCVRTKVPDPTL
jgi:hypothetical protein